MPESLYILIWNLIFYRFFEGLLKEGYELISEALNLLNNVYGAMHPEIAACLRLLARLNYIMGECFEVCATALEQKIALLIYHTVLRIFSTFSAIYNYRKLSFLAVFTITASTVLRI